MYISTMDMLAAILALLISITFIITTAIANAKLTISRDEWRRAYHNYKFATEAEAMGKPYCWNSNSKKWEYM
jgi:hypothetical protein